MQGGDERGPHRLIEAHINSDEGFLETLENPMSKITSSDRGTFKVLKEQNVAHFMDYEAAVSRVRDLENDALLGRRAKRLTEALELGAKY